MSQTGNRINASTASTASVIRAIAEIRRRRSPMSTAPISACASIRWRRPTWRVATMASTDPIVMIPNPPTWINSRMTSSPNSENRLMSVDARPVTVAADVDVKSASSSPMWPGPSAEIGSQSSAVPRAMNATNAPTTSCAGFPIAAISLRRGTAGAYDSGPSP